jgi:predicted phage terminase large subunit-like protein
LIDFPLVEWIPRLSPEFKAPYHLLDWCRVMEGCLNGGVRALNAVTIRHWKSWTTFHGMAWVLERDPTYRWIWMGADHERANEVGKYIRKLCESVGKQSDIEIGPTRGDNTILDWKNRFGGGVVCMSAEQSKLGRDIDGLVVDDALTEQTEGDVKVRDAIDNAIAHYTARAGRPTRRGSVAIVMSPWNLDDPIARRRNRKAADWKYIHSPAIIDLDLPTERAFAPEIMTLEEIKQRRAELREVDPAERIFWAQFMCDPRAQVDARFKVPKRYEALPEYPGARYGMGVDLAYSPGEGDYFAAVTVKFYGGIAYIVDVVRDRADFNILENLIRNRWTRYGRCPIYSYIAGPEKGAVRYFTDRGIAIQGMPARYNKSTRAQKTIDFWNAGRIMVPLHDAWATGFVSRCLQFTGSEKERDDDEIDAMVSIVDAMMGTDASRMPRAFGGRTRA